MEEKSTNVARVFDKDQKEILFKQYQLLIDAYKYYLEIVLKFIIFHYAVTGAILSFYLSRQNAGIMRFALVFPIFMSVVFAVFAFFGSYRVFYMTEEVQRITALLDLGGYPDPKFLEYVLRIARMSFSAIAIGLVVVSFAR